MEFLLVFRFTLLVISKPKWLSCQHPGYACLRKCFSMRGMGDFTLVTSQQREVLDADQIVYSHNDPPNWRSVILLKQARFLQLEIDSNCRDLGLLTFGGLKVE